MADASTWADEIKRERPETRPWHYVDIPLNDLVYRASLCPQNACVVAQIEREVKIVADKTLLKPLRAEALRFLVHFVGDEHQPMHCGENHDRGGNEVKVRLNRRNTNLHGVGYRRGQGARQERREARQRPVGQDHREERQCVVVGHVETAIIAKNVVYAGRAGQGGTSAPVVLPPDYISESVATTAQQLQKASVRLAALLNGVWK